MKKSFRYRLFTLFLGSSIIPMIAIGSFLSLYYSNLNNQANRQNIMNTLYMVSENIGIYLDDVKRVSISPSVYSDVTNYYTMLNRQSGEVSYSNYVLALNYRNLMQRMLTLAREDIRGVAFVPQNNPDGLIYVIDTQQGTTFQHAGYDYRSAGWYQAALESEGTPVFTASHTMEYYSVGANGGQPDPEEGLFSVTRLVHSEHTRAAIGVIKVDASDTIIRDIFSNISTPENSGLLLLDKNGELVWTSNELLGGLSLQIPPADGRLVTDSDSYNIHSQMIENTGWRLVYLDSTRDVRTQVRNIAVISGAVALCCAMVAFLIFRYFSHRITSPVQNIIQTMKQVEQGNLNARCYLPDYANQEFTLIGGELNSMIAKLEALINSEYKAVISQRNAEFLALQTQVNPHFLYNTLNGLITLNRLGEKKKLEDTILRLTGLFRYTCSNQNHATVGEEMRFLEMYLSLQQLRFEDRLKFEIRVEDGVRNVTIPRLLVQPLVENAVIHGMEPSEREFLLEIDAFSLIHPALGRLLVLSVFDNGVGFDAVHGLSNRRVGLLNVEERLELFRSEGAFVIKSKPGKGTHCILLIPLPEIS